MQLMKLARRSGDCPDGINCPAVYATDRDTLVVQGYKITDLGVLDQLALPDGETAVEIPRSLLQEASL